jgi:hypothetical protein
MLDNLSAPLEEKQFGSDDSEDEVRDEDEALDVSFDNNSPLPTSLKVTMKKASLKLQHLCNWLMKNGHEYEAYKVKKIIMKKAEGN